MKKKYKDWQKDNPSPLTNLPPSGAMISERIINEFRKRENDAYLYCFIDSLLEFLDQQDELDRS